MTISQIIEISHADYHKEVNMAIDAVIDAIRRHPDCDELLLRPRIDREGRPTIAGRRSVTVLPNPEYRPQTGDEIWGNGTTLAISKAGKDHKFTRVPNKEGE